MLPSILLVLFYLGMPALFLWLESRSRVIRFLSPIIICYLVGVLVGNIPGLPLNESIQVNATSISVALAIPLLLFSANFLRMLKRVRPALFAFGLGIAGVIVCVVVAFLIFRERIGDAGAASGMMIGVYTGGTQNMNAIGIALNVEEEVFVLLNSADIIISAFYFLFLLSVGKRFISLFLPVRKGLWNGAMDESEAVSQDRSTRESAIHVLKGLGLAAIVLGMAVGISYLVTGGETEAIIILGITTLGIAASFVPRIRRLPHTFSTANYLLLVFALAMGSRANFAELLSSSGSLFYFCGFVVFGSVILHYVLAFLFRIDRDTLIISSTASIFGPAFIGPVANAIGNREIIPIGIALGLLGYALGNYLGLAIAFILNG